MAFLKFDEIFDLSSTFTSHVSQSCVVNNTGVTGSVKLSAFNPGTLKYIGEIAEPTDFRTLPTKPSAYIRRRLRSAPITFFPTPFFYESNKYATTLQRMLLQENYHPNLLTFLN